MGFEAVGEERKRIDGHTYIEREPYTLDWTRQFIDRAVETGLDVDKIYRRYFGDSLSLASSKLFDGIRHPWQKQTFTKRIRKCKI